VRKYGI
jgi:methylenetetrahydrofolate reductase (NADPH)